jgi:membrane fusion protein, multidrug efflux system
MSAIQRRFTPVMVAATLASTLALGACKPQAPVASAPPQPVQVLRVDVKPAAQTWSYTGTIRPRFETDQGFRVAGKIVARRVDVGTRVTAGQVLAELDTTDLTLALETQAAELSAAMSTREQAVAAEGRFKSLHAQGHVAKAALDQRIATADEARSRVERAERSVTLARNQLAYAHLKAEHAGTVTSLMMEAGQVVAVGQAVARVARLDEIDAQVALPEQVLAAVKQAKADVEIWGGDGRRIGATLRELAPEADRVSRTYLARFALQSGGTAVDLGRTAAVHLTAPGTETAVRVPLSAVMNDGAGAAVWKITGDGTRVTRTPVAVTSLSKDHVTVSGDIVSGDQIVTLGVHMLDAGKPVRIVAQHAALN